MQTVPSSSDGSLVLVGAFLAAGSLTSDGTLSRYGSLSVFGAFGPDGSLVQEVYPSPSRWIMSST
jgi:hypothetical protein